MIGKTISHYKILEKLGEGGMGVVYKAEDTKLKRTVALKFLSQQAVASEEDKKRFVREARAAAALDHPNICTVYEIDEVEGQTFIAMAYLDGESLKAKIEDKPLKLDEALAIAMQVTQGLHEAHENGIVHRDIKPANIMLSKKGQAKIMDFGLAKLAGGTKLTKTNMTLGTVAYMSPEQAQGESVDHRSDIFSFAVVLYEVLTGQHPFKGEYEQAVVYSILHEEPEPMTGLRTGIPMELERIVNKSMAKSPDDRYQHVDEMLVDLKSVARELEHASSPHWPARLQKSVKVGWTKASMFAAPVLLLALAAIWLISYFGSETADVPAPVSRTAIAVLPFSVRGGEEIAYLKEGMVDLLSTKLDGAGELRSIDPKALLGFIAKNPQRVIDPQYGQEIASHFGAGRYILGTVLKAGDQILTKLRLIRRERCGGDESTGRCPGRDPAFVHGGQSCTATHCRSAS